ncbi:MAG: tripartite tricarboxylate transporter TctB family protein [Proteobacteria bacterium]|nr:tripartite tricarboxylate transporter TctB family protein [Pseudomonadota bacterium]
MTEKQNSNTPDKRSIGGDMVIPVVALGFTLYYFSTIIDSPWTAQVSAFFIGTILIVLAAVFIFKSVAKVRLGEAGFGFSKLFSKADITSGRLSLFIVTVLYILLIEWGGFTLTTFGFLFSGMLVLSKGRDKGFIALLSAGLSLVGYGLFIIVFETRLPHGPFEWLMALVL